MKIGCALLAAGTSSRFGSNKLKQSFHGHSLFEIALLTLSAVEGFSCTTIVSRDDDMLLLAKRHGFDAVLNNRPDLGISRSIKLALEHMKGLDAVMFMVCDQPLLKPESIIRLIKSYKDAPNHIHALSYMGRRGNPVIFPSMFFDELLNLSGDVGGNAIIKRHPQNLVLCEATSGSELMDIDDTDSFLRLYKMK
ncbi:MAG: nucleotidyltransferase family protein [Clostridia bacterium]|nr:nucleotidyltransferase family protein [Clostridia bacterium]